MDWTKARVAVTGATGFIGGRLVEHLVLDKGAQVRCLVRDFNRCAGLSRFPVELVRCGLGDTSGHEEALAGCTQVVHCGYAWHGSPQESQWVNVEGTVSLVRAAERVGCQRFVHVSTDAVHAFPSAPEIAEDHPLSRFPHSYIRTKVALERRLRTLITREHAKVCIVRPAIVFGPGFNTWTTDVASELSARTLPVVEGGTGVCNSTYVDNLVLAFCLACERPEASGEAFFVTDGQPLSWEEYLTPFARALGVELGTLPQRTAAAARRVKPREGQSLAAALAAVLAVDSAREELWKVLWLRKLWLAARPALRKGTDAPPAPDETEAKAAPRVGGRYASPDAAMRLHVYANGTRYSVDKARRLLGYQPIVRWSEAVERTLAWLQFARIVPQE